MSDVSRTIDLVVRWSVDDDRVPSSLIEDMNKLRAASSQLAEQLSKTLDVKISPDAVVQSMAQAASSISSLKDISKKSAEEVQKELNRTFSQSLFKDVKKYATPEKKITEEMIRGTIEKSAIKIPAEAVTTSYNRAREINRKIDNAARLVTDKSSLAEQFHLGPDSSKFKDIIVGMVNAKRNKVPIPLKTAEDYYAIRASAKTQEEDEMLDELENKYILRLSTPARNVIPELGKIKDTEDAYRTLTEALDGYYRTVAKGGTLTKEQETNLDNVFKTFERVGGTADEARNMAESAYKKFAKPAKPTIPLENIVTNLDDIRKEQDAIRGVSQALNEFYKEYYKTAGNEPASVAQLTESLTRASTAFDPVLAKSGELQKLFDKRDSILSGVGISAESIRNIDRYRAGMRGIDQLKTESDAGIGAEDAAARIADLQLTLGKIGTNADIIDKINADVMDVEKLQEAFEKVGLSDDVIKQLKELDSILGNMRPNIDTEALDKVLNDIEVVRKELRSLDSSKTKVNIGLEKAVTSLPTTAPLPNVIQPTITPTIPKPTTIPTIPTITPAVAQKREAVVSAVKKLSDMGVDVSAAELENMAKRAESKAREESAKGRESKSLDEMFYKTLATETLGRKATDYYKKWMTSGVKPVFRPDEGMRSKFGITIGRFAEGSRSQAAEQLSVAMQDATDKGVEYNQILGVLQRSMHGAYKEVGTDKQGLVGAFARLGNYVEKNSRSLGWYAYRLTRIGTMLQNVIMGPLNTVINKLKSWSGSIEESIPAIAYGPLFGYEAPASTDVADYFKKTVNSGMQMEYATSRISMSWQNIANDVGPAIAGIMVRISDAMDKIWKIAGPGVTKIFESLGQSGGAFDRIIKVFEEVGPDVLTSFAKGIEVAANSFAGFFEIAKPFLPVLGELVGLLVGLSPALIAIGTAMFMVQPFIAFVNLIKGITSVPGALITFFRDMKTYISDIGTLLKDGKIADLIKYILGGKTSSSIGTSTIPTTGGTTGGGTNVITTGGTGTAFSMIPVSGNALTGIGTGYEAWASTVPGTAQALTDAGYGLQLGASGLQLGAVQLAGVTAALAAIPLVNYALSTEGQKRVWNEKQYDIQNANESAITNMMVNPNAVMTTDQQRTAFEEALGNAPYMSGGSMTTFGLNPNVGYQAPSDVYYLADREKWAQDQQTMLNQYNDMAAKLDALYQNDEAWKSPENMQAALKQIGINTGYNPGATATATSQVLVDKLQQSVYVTVTIDSYSGDISDLEGALSKALEQYMMKKNISYGGLP